jgi:hypothetical protein
MTTQVERSGNQLMRKRAIRPPEKKQTEAERLLDELANEIGPQLKAKGITEENVVAEMCKVRKTLSWKKLRELSGIVSLGGDALADSEALYDGD